MWLLTTLFLWAPAGGQVAHPAKAVIILQPPWVNIFQEESVTLICEGPHLPEDKTTRWFLNGTSIQILSPTYTITAASIDNGGEYRCQTGLSTQSDPVQLEIHRDWLLLQVSSRNFIEGEPLALRCHGWKNKRVYKVVFYQDGNAFKFSPQLSNFTILKTNVNHSGVYHCSGSGKDRYSSAGVSVTVTELFPAPVLRASLPPTLLEGSTANLSCETKLLQQRPGSRLYFSFYLGSKPLRSRNTSSEYQIPSARAEDSGFYWCEAATEDGKVQKRSPELELQVLSLHSPTPVWFHILFYVTMGILFLIDTVFYVTMHKELQRRRIWNLETLLGSGFAKKVNSDLQKDKHVYDELKGQKQEQLQEESEPPGSHEEAQLSEPPGSQEEEVQLTEQKH